MATKPYLISIASKTPGYARYRATRELVLPSVQAIDVVFHHQYPGNLYRWDYLPPDLDPDRMLIFTDTDDVIFQLPIPRLENRIYVANEGVAFKENGFWQGVFDKSPNRMREQLNDVSVYNAGCWAMPVEDAYRLQMFMRSSREILPDPHADQIYFNLWLKNQEYTEHPFLFTTLYANLEKEYVKIIDKTFVNKDGMPYCIVHGNGDSGRYLP